MDGKAPFFGIRPAVLAAAPGPFAPAGATRGAASGLRKPLKRLDRNFRAPSGNVAITGCCVRKRHPAAGQKSILFPSGFFNILIFQILNNIFDTMQFLPIPLQPLPHPQPPAAPTPQARKSFDQTFSKVCGIQRQSLWSLPQERNSLRRALRAYSRSPRTPPWQVFSRPAALLRPQARPGATAVGGS